MKASQHHCSIPVVFAHLLVVSGCTGPPATERGSYRLRINDPIEHLATDAVREPMVVEHPDGVLFVAGYTQNPAAFEQPPLLFMSSDSGATWTAVDVGTSDQGAIGNSDVDLAVGPDGTLYFLTMGFDRTTSRGTHVAVGVSRDVGESWRWQFLSQDTFDDRPWIVVTPEGTAHVTWNDGSGVSHAVSTDGGFSWTERTRIHPQGGSSHLAAGHEGELAVRITPLSASGNRFHEGIDLLAVSVDSGTTWEKFTPPGHREWDASFTNPDGVVRWVEPIAWSEDGSLNHVWSEGTELWLGRSMDHGRTWGTWLIATSQHTLFFPYLVSGSDSMLAATWYSGAGDSLRVHGAIIEVNETGQPTLGRTPPIEFDSWRGTGTDRVRDTAGEYVPIIFLADGDVAMVTPIQNTTENRFGFSWHRIVR